MSVQYVAAFNFVAENSDELSVNQGELLNALGAPEDGWIHVVKANDSSADGFIPMSYVKPAQASYQAAPAPRRAPPAPMQQQQSSSQHFAAQQQVPPALSHQASSSSQNSFQQQSSQHFQQQQQQASQHFQQQPSQHIQQQHTRPPPITMPTNYYNVPVNNNNAMNKPPATGSIDTNAQNFGETLELWRERERRFMKGEAEKLPEVRERKYFYWDANGNRIGPLTEAEMKNRFHAQQVQKDTMVSLQTIDDQQTMPTQKVEDFFPDPQVAFSTAPVALPNSQMWTYIDDNGQIQGPFPAEQMRQWFQDGYFNAETKARLADKTNMNFVPLGVIFPEGVGAFLSEGDQMAALAYVPNQTANVDMMTANLGNFNPFDTNPNNNVPGGQRTSYTTGMGGAPEYFQQQQQVQQFQQIQNPFESNAAYGDLGVLDNTTSGGGEGAAGRDLLFSALGDQNSNTSSSPPEAIQNVSDDWGISWDDEEEEKALAPHSQSEEAAVPMPIHGDESDDDEEDENGEKKKKEELVVAKLTDLRSRFLENTDTLYRFLTRPVPKDIGTIRCQIVRSLVGMHVNYNVYDLYLEDENGKRSECILTATKHKSFTTSFFNIQIGSVNTREAGTTIAKLNLNMYGTYWVLHNDVKAHKGKARDLCCVTYQKNIGKGPRRMKVALPAFKDEDKNTMVEYRHQGSVKNSKMLKDLKSLNLSDLKPLINKPPQWSKKYRSWTLNFHGRVTRASVKNFQLVEPNDKTKTVLQHGRVGSNTFTLDFSHPLSPIAAFSIAVSSLHAKLAVE